MDSIFGVRRIMAGVFVVAMAAAGLAIGAGWAGAQEVIEPGPRPAPNCTVPGDGREPGPAPEAIIIEPGPREGNCATLRVTKVVNGTAPAGTTFHVVVQCEPKERVILPPVLEKDLPPGQFPPFSTVLTFPETGGTQDVFIARPSSCTPSETAPPGCTLASIDPAKVEITQPNVFQVLVTNNCAAPQPPAPVSIQGTIVVNQPPAASPVVVARPRFTG